MANRDISGLKMDKEGVLRKINESNFPENTFSKKICNLILNGEFDKALDSNSLTTIYNEGPGKNIKPSDLNALMQPLLIKDIVKIKTLKNGKKKIKFWLPAWISKNESLDKGSNLLIKNLHPEIRDVSEKLFNNEHYAQAIEEAFKKIVNLVKQKSERSDLDGSSLMTNVFNKNNPLLKFNKLLDQTERDEQEGWMHLYLGAVLGIRNLKAHKNIIQKDKNKTSEYLAFASLLCRRLDDASK